MWTHPVFSVRLVDSADFVIIDYYEVIRFSSAVSASSIVVAVTAVKHDRK